MKRCPMCRRTYATETDWAALAADSTTGTCRDDACPWGGDRCWNAGSCGISAQAVVSQVSAATALRRRRTWAGVPHPQACRA